MVGTVIFAIALIKLLATNRNSLKPEVSYCLSQEVVGGLEDFLVKQEEVGEQEREDLVVWLRQVSSIHAPYFHMCHPYSFPPSGADQPVSFPLSTCIS